MFLDYSASCDIKNKKMKFDKIYSFSTVDYHYNHDQNIENKRSLTDLMYTVVVVAVRKVVMAEVMMVLEILSPSD